jgi:protocatechuate 3,4-dioxygenase beta subunit
MNKIKWLAGLLIICLVIVLGILFIPKHQTKNKKIVQVNKSQPVTIAQSSLPIKNEPPKPQPEPTSAPLSTTNNTFSEHPVIFGTATDENEVPVSSVAITIIKVVSAAGHSEPKRISLLTDASGRYKSRALDIGRYAVLADCNGFQFVILHTEIIDVSQDAEVNIRLKRAGFVSGRVTDENNKPFKGLMIETHEYSENTHHYYPTRSAPTDENGHYEIWGIASPECEVWHDKAGDYLSEAKTVPVNSANVDFALQIGGRIEVRVINKATKNVLKPDELKIEAQGNLWEAADGSYSSCTPYDDFSITDDGNFIFRALPEGDYRVEVDATRCKSQRVGPFKVVKNDTTKITMEMVQGGSIEGIVIDKNTRQPLKDVLVYYNTTFIMNGKEYHNRADCYNKNLQTHSNEEGRFILSRLDDNTYTVAVLFEGRNYIPKQVKPEIVIKNGNSVTGLVIEMERGGIIEGRVSDKDTGNSITTTNFTLYVSGLEWEDVIISLDQASGRFTVMGLKDGTYVLEAGAWYKPDIENYGKTRSQEIIIKDGNTVSGIVLELQKSRFISGTVLDENNRPISNIDVVVWVNNLGYYGSTDGMGRYRITGFEDGANFVVANERYSHSGNEYCRAEKQNVRLNSSDIDFVLYKNGGSIEGRVIDRTSPNQIPDTAINLHYYYSHGSNMNSYINGQITVGEDGAFSATKLTPGKYNISIYSDSKIYKPVRDVEVHNGQATQIIIQLDPKPFLGVMMDDSSQPGTQGTSVVSVVPDSPAAKVGLKAKDIIMAINGIYYGTAAEISNLISNSSVGDKFIVKVKRDDKIIELTVILEEMPKEK